MGQASARTPRGNGLSSCLRALSPEASLLFPDRCVLGPDRASLPARWTSHFVLLCYFILDFLSINQSNNSVICHLYNIFNAQKNATEKNQTFSKNATGNYRFPPKKRGSPSPATSTRLPSPPQPRLADATLVGFRQDRDLSASAKSNFGCFSFFLFFFLFLTWLRQEGGSWGVWMDGRAGGGVDGRGRASHFPRPKSPSGSHPSPVRRPVINI